MPQGGTGSVAPDVGGGSRRMAWFNPLGLPGPLSLKQKLYIIFPQMIGAAIIDGAVNFAAACAMYRSAEEVRMWPLDKHTVAGDMAATTFIQGVASFVIASGMVHVDLRSNKIAAFPVPWPDTSYSSAWRVADPEVPETRRRKLWRQFHNEHGLGRGLHFFSGSDINDVFDFTVGKKRLSQRWFWSIWKGSVLSALYFIIIWPIAIAITAPLYGGVNMAGTWTPEIVKLLYGAFYGLLMNPICCLIAMGSEDSVRHHRAEMQHLRFLNPDTTAMSTTAAERKSPRTGSFPATARTSLDWNMTETRGSVPASPRNQSEDLDITFALARRVFRPHDEQSPAEDRARRSHGASGEVVGVDTLRRSLETSRSVYQGRNASDMARPASPTTPASPATPPSPITAGIPTPRRSFNEPRLAAVDLGWKSSNMHHRRSLGIQNAGGGHGTSQSASVSPNSGGGLMSPENPQPPDTGDRQVTLTTTPDPAISSTSKSEHVERHPMLRRLTEASEVGPPPSLRLQGTDVEEV